MTTTLTEILASHEKWLADPKTGTRANLAGANLASANLASANLRSADLASANLASADLASADLRDASLRGANLRSADLASANLASADLASADLASATGIVCAGTDRRGYRFVGVLHVDGWRVAAGCRWFTLPEAVAHWTAKGNHDALARLAVIQAATPESTL